MKLNKSDKLRHMLLASLKLFTVVNFAYENVVNIRLDTPKRRFRKLDLNLSFSRLNHKLRVVSRDCFVLARFFAQGLFRQLDTHLDTNALKKGVYIEISVKVKYVLS